MKLAWMCYPEDRNFDIGYNPNRAIIIFSSMMPSAFEYAKIIRIVYSEIE